MPFPSTQLRLPMRTLRCSWSGRPPRSWNEGYAYMALCCWDLNKDEEFMSYLEQAIKKNPKETRMVLGGIFPKNLPIEDYYEYMHNQLNKDRS